MINWILSHGDAFSVIGGILEISGVILMANRFLKDIPWYEIVLAILSAIWRGKWTGDAVIVFDCFGEEDSLITMQGLAFIGWGFVIQMIPPVLRLFC